MKKKIYVLTHNRPHTDYIMLPEGKLLGLHLTLESALEAIKETYITTPGFEDHPEDFMIEEFIVADTDWLDGFDGPINVAENLVYKGSRPNLNAQKFTSTPGEPYFAYPCSPSKDGSDAEQELSIFPT